MGKLNSVTHEIDYPIYGAKFLNDATLLVTGGDGSSMNRLTALTINLEKKKKPIKKFRELKLNESSDAPTALDANNNVILLGCNEGDDSIQQGHNHNLQKFLYHNDHLKYITSTSLETPIFNNLQYQKFVRLSHDASIAAIASSKVPTVIHILDPINLIVKYEIETNNEVQDLEISPDGKSLVYITNQTLEVISIVTGRSLQRRTDFKDSSLLKIKFINKNNFILVSSLNKGGIQINNISLKNKLKTFNSKIIDKKSKSITAIDVNEKNGIIVLSTDEDSLVFINIESFKHLKTFSNLHKLSITQINFSPNGKFLASVSSGKTVNIIEIPDFYGIETHRVYYFFLRSFQLLIFAVIIQASWLVYQNQTSKRSHDDEFFSRSQRTLSPDMVYESATTEGNYAEIIGSKIKSIYDNHLKDSIHDLVGNNGHSGIITDSVFIETQSDETSKDSYTTTTSLLESKSTKSSRTLLQPPSEPSLAPEASSSAVESPAASANESSITDLSDTATTSTVGSSKKSKKTKKTKKKKSKKSKRTSTESSSESEVEALSTISATTTSETITTPAISEPTPEIETENEALLTEIEQESSIEEQPIPTVTSRAFNRRTLRRVEQEEESVETQTSVVSEPETVQEMTEDDYRGDTTMISASISIASEETEIVEPQSVELQEESTTEEESTTSEEEESTTEEELSETESSLEEELGVESTVNEEIPTDTTEFETESTLVQSSEVEIEEREIAEPEIEQIEHDFDGTQSFPYEGNVVEGSGIGIETAEMSALIQDSEIIETSTGEAKTDRSETTILTNLETEEVLEAKPVDEVPQPIENTENDQVVEEAKMTEAIVTEQHEEGERNIIDNQEDEEKGESSDGSGDDEESTEDEQDSTDSSTSSCEPVNDEVTLDIESSEKESTTIKQQINQMIISESLSSIETVELMEEPTEVTGEVPTFEETFEVEETVTILQPSVPVEDIVSELDDGELADDEDSDTEEVTDSESEERDGESDEIETDTESEIESIIETIESHVESEIETTTILESSIKQHAQSEPEDSVEEPIIEKFESLTSEEIVQTEVPSESASVQETHPETESVENEEESVNENSEESSGGEETSDEDNESDESTVSATETEEYAHDEL